MRSVHQRRQIPVLVTGLAVAALSAACGDDGCRAGRDLEVNTLRIVVDGGLELDTVVKALGGFQSVATGRAGIHVYKPRSSLRDQLPGRPSPGTYSVGRWDPSRITRETPRYVDPPG